MERRGFIQERRTRARGGTRTRQRGQRTAATGRARGEARHATPAFTGGKASGFVDLALASYAQDTTGSITLIATVAQGTTTSERVGKRIVWKSLQAHGSSSNGTTATRNDCSFLIVYDRRPRGALPAITDVLVTANSRSFNNDAFSGRFAILKRVDYVLMGQGGAGTLTGNGFSKNVDFFLDLRKLKCNFAAAGTGAIGDIEEGSLYLVTVGNVAAGTAAATLSLAFRTRFIDVAG